MARKPATKPKEQAGPAITGEVALGPDCRIAIFHGPEAFLRTGYTDQLKERVEAAGHEVQVVRFDGLNAQPVEVLDECRSMALLAPYKIVIVDDADQFLKEPGEGEEGEGKADDRAESKKPRSSSRRAMLERYVQSPCDHVTLVLRAESWRKGNLDKYAAQVGTVIECGVLDARRAAGWAVARALKKHERTLEPDAAARLVEAVNVELARIDGELMKLAGATRPGEPITLRLVEKLVSPVAATQEPWRFADHLLNPSPSPALHKLHELIDECGIDPVPIRWACIGLASNIHVLAHEIAQGVPPAAAGKSLKFFFGPRAEAARRTAAAIGPSRAADLLQECVEADYRGKSGREDPVRGLELLSIRFAEAASFSPVRSAGR